MAPGYSLFWIIPAMATWKSILNFNRWTGMGALCQNWSTAINSLLSLLLSKCCNFNLQHLRIFFLSNPNWHATNSCCSVSSLELALTILHWREEDKWLLFHKLGYFNISTNSWISGKWELRFKLNWESQTHSLFKLGYLNRWFPEVAK